MPSNETHVWEHEIRRRLLQETSLKNVVATYKHDEPDELVLVLPDGDAVVIRADRIWLSLIEDYEQMKRQMKKLEEADHD